MKLGKNISNSFIAFSPILVSTVGENLPDVSCSSLTPRGIVQVKHTTIVWFRLDQRECTCYKKGY